MSNFRCNNYRYLCPILTCFALAALYPSDLEAKCKSTNTLKAGDSSFTVEFDGITRTVNVHVPSSYDGLTPVALVFDLHGSYGNGPSQMAGSGFVPVSDENNFILVAPTGNGNFWNGDIAFGTAYEAGTDDVGFMKAVVKHMADIANINHGKVYSTGLSNGGAMSNTLGCQASDTFAAIAPVSDPLDIGLKTCKPVPPISVLGFHGYSDDAVPYDGGQGSGPSLGTPFPSIPDTLKNWAKIMSCTGTPELIQFEGTNKCEIYRKCAGGRQVGYCSLEGGHALYIQPYLNIAEYAWGFFNQFSLLLPDADKDGIPDEDDNCLDIANPDQADKNGNCIGDACECTNTTDCDDRVFCNGSESCTSGVCKRGTNPCKANQKCDESLRQCVDASTMPDAGVTGGSGAAGAKGGKDAGESGGPSGTAIAGQAGGAAGSPVEPTAGHANTGSAGSDSTGAAQQVASKTDTGCGCHVLGKTGGSTRPFLSFLTLLGIGMLLLSSRRNKRARLRNQHSEIN